MFRRLKYLIVGKPRDLRDPNLFHHVTLGAFLVWVAAGADGISSSCYGPAQIFNALRGHEGLGSLVALIIAFLVVVFGWAYTVVCEASTRGGYGLSMDQLGRKAGATSGVALGIDYALTVSVSVFEAIAAITSVFGIEDPLTKLLMTTAAIGLLVLLNLRGVRESAQAMAPFFLLFIVSHIVLIVGVLIRGDTGDPQEAIRQAGGHGKAFTFFIGLKLLLQAVSKGAGTFTGLEASSSIVPLMKEPRIKTARLAMLLIGGSLAFMASGLLVAYQRAGVTYDMTEGGKYTMNYVLAEHFTRGAGTLGWLFLVVTMASESILLIVAAQAGFVGGPRTMANMAADKLLPPHFNTLSERLTTHYGVWVIGALSLAFLWISYVLAPDHEKDKSGEVLVGMYSINVFLGFMLGFTSTTKVAYKNRTDPKWRRRIPGLALATAVAAGMFVLMLVEKWDEGAKPTVIVTAGALSLCLWIDRYYRKFGEKITSQSQRLPRGPVTDPVEMAALGDLEMNAPTVFVCVSGNNALAEHTVLHARHQFPDRQLCLLIAEPVDASMFQHEGDGLAHVRKHARRELDGILSFAHSYGLRAGGLLVEGVNTADALADAIYDESSKYSRVTVVAGNVVYTTSTPLAVLFHNQVTRTLDTLLGIRGIPMLKVPFRIVGYNGDAKPATTPGVNGRITENASVRIS